MNFNRKFIPVFLATFVLAACGGGGGDKGAAVGSSGTGGDSFVSYVQQLSATEPETGEPMDAVESVSATQPEDTQALDII